MSAHFLIYLTIPHPRNNHKAALLKSQFLFLSLVVFLLVQIALTNLPRVFPVILGYASNIPASRVVELTNDERKKAGFPELEVSPILSSAAAAKAADMLARDYWAHIAPDGTQPWKYFKDSGYNYRYAGENLARDFSNPEDVVSAWMASASHRENLLSARYQEIGIAVIEGDLGGVDTTLVVQFFGSRGVASIASEPGESKVAEGRQASLQETAVVATKTRSQAIAPPQTVGQSVSSGKIVISPFWTNKRIFLAFILTLIALLTIDIVVVWHKKVARIAGKSLAHLSFLVMVLSVILFLRAGVIL